MTTPEDLAKAEQIVRKHCGANIRATGPTVTDDDWEPGYAGLRDTIAQALAEARTTPKPAAEVVEALVKALDNILKHWFISATITQCRSNVRRNETNDGERMLLVYSQDAEAALAQARAALAAHSAREGE